MSDAQAKQWDIDQAFATLTQLTEGSHAAKGAMKFLLGEIARLHQAGNDLAGRVEQLQQRVMLLEAIPCVVESESGNPGWVDAKDAVRMLAELRSERDAMKADAERYRFIRRSEVTLDTADEELLASVWEKISKKGCWEAAMDAAIDAGIGASLWRP